MVLIWLDHDFAKLVSELYYISPSSGTPPKKTKCIFHDQSSMDVYGGGKKKTTKKTPLFWVFSNFFHYVHA